MGRMKNENIYLRIENKDCKEYKTLHGIILGERECRQKQKELLRGIPKFDKWHGYGYEDTFNRMPKYFGFQFSDDAEIGKGWRKSKDGDYVPDKRSARGRELAKLLGEINSVCVTSCWGVAEAVGAQILNGRFSLPILRMNENGVIFLRVSCDISTFKPTDDMIMMDVITWGDMLCRSVIFDIDS